MEAYGRTVALLLEYVANPIASSDVYFESLFNSAESNYALSTINTETLVCNGSSIFLISILVLLSLFIL